MEKDFFNSIAMNFYHDGTEGLGNLVEPLLGQFNRSPLLLKFLLQAFPLSSDLLPLLLVVLDLLGDHLGELSLCLLAS